MSKERAQISDELKWDLSPLFASDEEWERAFKKERGKLLKQPLDEIEKILDTYFLLYKELEELYTYAHLKHDEDVSNEKYKGYYDMAVVALTQFEEETAWLKPSLIEEVEVTSSKYAFYLSKVRTLKPYTLKASEERIMALSGQISEFPYKAFGVFHNADLKFEPVQGEPLTHGSYSLFLQSKDRNQRKEAFFHLHEPYLKYANTFTELISGAVQKHLFTCRARSYPSCLDAALIPHQIPRDVYTNLIQTVKNQIGGLHDYVSLRKEILGVGELFPYDLYVPLEEDLSRTYTIEEAKELVIEAVRPLGEAYRDVLAKGFREGRWVDWVENARKRSGAYSSGCYSSPPYILMNFQGTIRDVFTLAHEAGHSMHSYLSHQNQPYHSSHYPIFLAEVASTYNEELLFNYLLKETSDVKERRWLINHKLDDVRSTLHRQTQFAEFELKLHEMGERDVPFSVGRLKNLYLDLYLDYYGPDLTLPDEISIEFLRVPHFYYNFYVYQYATGISAAHALCKQGDVKKYLKFLSSGGSNYPIELLREVGVDLRTAEPINMLLQQFKSYLGEYRCLREVEK
ncbi:MAG: oligoendopeptidase F [Simkaniaceae bacterium]|nr:oligoendopeptidase F [Simkaniaceae bacterium]